MGVRGLWTWLREKTGNGDRFAPGTAVVNPGTPDEALREVLVDGWSFIFKAVEYARQLLPLSTQGDPHIKKLLAKGLCIESHDLADCFGGDQDRVREVMAALIRTLHDKYRLRLVFLIDGHHNVRDPQTDAEHSRAALDKKREADRDDRAMKRQATQLRIAKYFRVGRYDKLDKARQDSGLPKLALTEALTAIQRASARYGTEIIYLEGEVDDEVEAYVERYNPVFLLTNDTDMVILPKTGDVVFVDDFLPALLPNCNGAAMALNLPVYSNARLREHCRNCTPDQLAMAAVRKDNDAPGGDFLEVVDSVIANADGAAGEGRALGQLETARFTQYMAFSNAPKPPARPVKQQVPRGLRDLCLYDELCVRPTLLSKGGKLGYTDDIPLHHWLRQAQAAILGKRSFKLTKSPLDYMMDDRDTGVIDVPGDLSDLESLSRRPRQARLARVLDIFSKNGDRGDCDSYVDAGDARGLFKVCFLCALAACVEDSTVLLTVARAMCICAALSAQMKVVYSAFNEEVGKVPQEASYRGVGLLTAAAAIAPAFELVDDIFQLAGLWEDGQGSTTGNASARLAPSDIFLGTALILANSSEHYDALVREAKGRVDLESQAQKLLGQARLLGGGDDGLLSEQVMSDKDFQTPQLHHEVVQCRKVPFRLDTDRGKQQESVNTTALHHARSFDCLPAMCAIAVALKDKWLFDYLLPGKSDQADNISYRRNKVDPYCNDVLYFPWMFDEVAQIQEPNDPRRRSLHRVKCDSFIEKVQNLLRKDPECSVCKNREWTVGETMEIMYSGGLERECSGSLVCTRCRTETCRYFESLECAACRSPSYKVINVHEFSEIAECTRCKGRKWKVFGRRERNVSGNMEDKHRYYLQMVLARMSAITILAQDNGRFSQALITNCPKATAARMRSHPRCVIGASSTLHESASLPDTAICFGLRASRDAAADTYYANVAFAPSWPQDPQQREKSAAMAVVALLVANPPQQSGGPASPQLELGLAEATLPGTNHTVVAVQRWVFKQCKDHTHGIDLCPLLGGDTACSLEWAKTLLQHVNVILHIMQHGRDDGDSATNLSQLLDETHDDLFGVSPGAPSRDTGLPLAASVPSVVSLALTGAKGYSGWSHVEPLLLGRNGLPPLRKRAEKLAREVREALHSHL